MRLAFPVVLVASCWATSAAASPNARLVYSRAQGAERCADEPALRRAVAARIGYDPFFPVAPRTVVVLVSMRDRKLVARVELVGEDAQSQGARELVVESDDCGPLLDTMALTISIAIDPHALVGPRQPDPPPAPRPAAPEPVVEPVRETPPFFAEKLPAAPPSDPLTVLAVAAGRLSFGAGPSTAPGGTLGGAVRWRNVSLGLEGSVDASTGKETAGGGEVRAWLASGSLVPCFHFGPARACGLALVGRLEGSSHDLVSPRTQTSAFVAFGGRAGVSVPLVDRFFLDARADLVVNAAPATLRVGSDDVWTAPRLLAAFGAGAGVAF